MKTIPKGLRRSTRILLANLAILLLCSLLNWGVVSSWGNVKIRRLYLTGDDGNTISALMYTPQNATNDIPAPGIMMYHGGSGNARNHEAWALEYSRRGYVVISVDNLGSGNSEYNGRNRYSICDLFTNYMFHCPIVDNTQIIVSGHSIGGDFSQQMGLRYQPALTINSDGGGSVFNAETSLEHAYLVVTGGADKANNLERFPAKVVQQFANDGVMSPDEELVEGKIYGSLEEGNAHKFVLVPDQIHEGVFVNSAHIEAILDFSMQVVPAPNPIAASDQVWVAKDFLGLAGMFALVFFMLNTALFIIDQVPALTVVRQPLPRNVGLRGLGLGISVAAAILFPLLVLYTGGFGIINLLGGARNLTNPIFRVRFAHYAATIVLLLNLFGFGMFFLYLSTDGKKQGVLKIENGKKKVSLRDIGLTSEGSTKLDWSLIGKAALVSCIALAVGFGYMKLQGETLGTDFYCQFFGFKDIPVYKIPYYIPFIILWVPCFAVASVGMNVERRLPSTGKENLDTAIAMVVNGALATLTITVMCLIENAVQINIGTTAVALSNWGTDLTRIWGMPVGMFLGGMGNTYAYRKTGNVWLGAILMGVICCLAACLYGQTYPLSAFSIG